MSRTHLFVVVVLLGAAVVAGLLAVTRTVDLGAATQSASNARIAARTRSLDRLEASLRRRLAQQPPALSSTAQPTAPSAAQRTVSVRAAAPPVRTYAREREDDHDGAEHEGDAYADD